MASAVKVLWSKYRWYCEEPACPRLSFFKSPAHVRLRGQLVAAIIRSGRVVSETPAVFAASRWMVRAALNEACILTLP